MTLSTDCKSCREEIRFFSLANDRVRLAKKKGEKFELRCDKCKSIDLYHVDEINAEENKIILIVGLMIFIIGTPLILYLIWDYIFQFANVRAIVGFVTMIGIPFIFFLIINENEEKRVRTFNRFKLRGNIK